MERRRFPATGLPIRRLLFQTVNAEIFSLNEQNRITLIEYLNAFEMVGGFCVVDFDLSMKRHNGVPREKMGLNSHQRKL